MDCISSFTEWQLSNVIQCMQRDTSTASFMLRFTKASLITLVVVGLIAGTVWLGKTVTDPSRLKPTVNAEAEAMK